MKKYLITILSLLCIFVLHSTLISAHPMPLVIQEHSFTITKDKITLDYKLSMEPLVIDRFYPVIDTDNNGDISEVEINKFSDELLKSLNGRINNKDIVLKKIGHTVMPKEKIWSFQDQIKIQYEIQDPKILETNSFLFRNTRKFVTDDPNGDLITFNDTIETTPELKRLTSEVNIEPDYYEYTVDYKINDFKPVVGQTQSGNTTPKENQIKKFFDWTTNTSKKLTAGIFKDNNSGILFSVFALLLAFVAGSLHAITPGHGKSMMAAFLIGNQKNKFGDVLILGVAITLAHTIVIFVLGFILLFLKKTDTINQLLPYFEKVSAILLMLLAANLLNKAYQNYRHYKYHQHLGQDAAHEHTDEHSHFGIKHSHKPDNKKIKIRNKYDLFIAGLGGGIVPCVDALSLLILSVNLGRIGFGLVLILAFSLGLAAAIVLIGLLLVQGKNKLNLEKKYGAAAEIYSPLITGLFIIAYALKFFF